MRVNVDSGCLTDPRFKLLARLVEMSHFEVRGRCLYIWNECYMRANAILSEEEIDTLTEHVGFARALIASGLADQRKSGVRVRGVTERFGWVKSRRSAGKKGGEKTRERWKEKETAQLPLGHMLGHVPEHPLGHVPGPPDPAPDPAPALAPDHTPAPDQETPEAASGSLGLRQVTDCWQEHYVDRTQVNPTWGATQTKLLTPLIKQHGPDEVCRRIGILFTAPPTFLADGVPDIKTLVANFDKLAMPSKPNGQRQSGRLTAADLAAEAREELRRERGGAG